MYAAGDFLITLYDTPVYRDEFARKLIFVLPVLEPVLYLGIQNETYSRALQVLTAQGVGWINYHSIVIYLDAAGEEVDLEEEQGFIGDALLRARNAIDEFAGSK